MSGIEDAILDRASDNSAQTPIITIVVTVEEDIDYQQAQMSLASVRRGVLATESIVQNVGVDHSVDSFGAETVSGIEWSDAEAVKGSLRNEVRDAGYTIKGTSIMAEIRTSSF